MIPNGWKSHQPVDQYILNVTLSFADPLIKNIQKNEKIQTKVITIARDAEELPYKK